MLLLNIKTSRFGTLDGRNNNFKLISRVVLRFHQVTLYGTFLRISGKLATLKISRHVN